MPLTGRITAHLIAQCDDCRGTYPKTAEVCPKRLDSTDARNRAVEILRKAGWQVEGLNTKTERWFCPGCAHRR